MSGGVDDVVGVKKTSIGISTKVGPRCGVRAVPKAASMVAPISDASWTVVADFVTGATRGTWSSSCRAPDPQR